MTFHVKDYPSHAAQWAAALAYMRSDKRPPLGRL